MSAQSTMQPIDAAAARTPALAAVAAAAVRAIPPVWPLASSVAVNPFLGQSGQDLAQTAARLGRVAGIAVTMPRSWYQERIASGAITDDDLSGALSASPHARRPTSLATLKAAAATAAPPPKALPTVADIATEASGTDWPGLIAERFGGWAAGYFDAGQALWAAPQGKSAYAAWRAVATHDLTPEIIGLTGFATQVAEGPETAGQALAAAVARLGMPAAACETYFHQLLTSLGGWAQLARHRLWQAELAGGVTILAFEDDIGIARILRFIDGEDDDRSVVTDDLPDVLRAAWLDHCVTEDREHLALVYLFGRK